MTIRIALIGTGNAAQHHLAAAGMTANLEITAIAGRDAARAREFARRFCPACKVLAVEAALHSPAIDAVIIAVPPAAQADIAVAAFETGKHVLCEKPLAPRLAGAQRIESAWKSSGKVGMVNFCYRLIPEIAAFKSHLNSGTCGSLHLIQVEWILASRLDPALSHMWKADVEAGGGVLQNFGSQVIDYLFHDLPQVEILAARQKTLFPLRPDGCGELQPASGDEVTTVLFNVPGLCPAFMHLSLVSQPALGHRLTARGSQRTLEVHNPLPGSPAGPFLIKSSSIGGGDERGSAGLVNSRNETYNLAQLFKRVMANFEQAISTNSSSYAPDISSGVRAARIIHEIQRISRDVSAY